MFTQTKEQTVLNPLRVAEKAFGIGAGMAGSAFKAARGAIGQSGGRDGGSPASEHRPPPERRPAKPSITDGALAHKVQSVLFSDPSVPKGKIDINAVGHDVYLRGEAKTPGMINDLERQARAIPEVAQVENLLHLPKTPAPTRADTPERAQKTRRTKGNAPARKRTPKKVNAEAKKTVGETPKEQAAKGQGRKPAPMGSTKSASTRKAGTRKVNAEAKKTVGETPREQAAKGEGRKPAAMGSTAQEGNGSSSGATAKASGTSSPKPEDDLGG